MIYYPQMVILLIFPLLLLLFYSIKQVNQYERGVKFRFGKYVGLMEPGWRIVLPVIESWARIDIRVKAVDVPDQEAITKDNVSAKVNAVIYYRISLANKAVIEVEDFYYAVSQLAQTTMRNVVGETALDDLLS
ncbi:MAG: SPFH domain-containing protein, partial [Candidatus Daviesbacteria bacterium]|nr:SPFH domain-containing protein [Candidatus Daviesbacteria bacterium]